MVMSILRAIEACYAAIDDDRAWAEGILAALTPLGGHTGIHAVQFAHGPEGASAGELLASSAAQLDPFAAWLREALRRAGGSDVLHLGPGRVALLSRLLTAANRSRATAIRALLRSTGAADVLVIRADDDADEAAGATLVIAAPLASAAAIPSRGLRQLRQFAGHLCSALRLRRFVSTMSVAEDRAAVASLHAGKLAEAVAREARRSGKTAAPHETKAFWEGLANGGWSVIDHAHRADSFVFLLRRATPHDPRALTPREGEILTYVAMGLSNKEIGYELKIGSTTVATHLRIAEEKMGRLRRHALIAALGASAPR